MGVIAKLDMKKCDIEPWRRCCVWAGSHGSSSLLFVKSHEEAAIFTLLNFCFGWLSSMTGCLISRCGDWGSCLYLWHYCNRLWITCWHINCPISCQKPGIFFYGSFWAGSSVCIACKLVTHRHFASKCNDLMLWIQSAMRGMLHVTKSLGIMSLGMMG